MESTQTFMLEVPLWHMALLLTIMIACLAWRRYVLGILGAVLFVLYWGYIYNMDKLILVLILTLQAFSCED